MSGLRVGSGDGLLEVNGETINNIGWITLARGSGINNAVLNVYGGSLTYGGGGLACNWNGNASSVTGTPSSIINLLGDWSLTSTNEGVRFPKTSGNIGILNLNAGLLAGASVGGNGSVNFNGGTLKPAPSLANPFLSVAATCSSIAAARKIDDDGQTISLQPAASQAPTDYGVSSIRAVWRRVGLHRAAHRQRFPAAPAATPTAIAQSISGGTVTRLW